MEYCNTKQYQDGNKERVLIHVENSMRGQLVRESKLDPSAVLCPMSYIREPLRATEAIRQLQHNFRIALTHLPEGKCKASGAGSDVFVYFIFIY